MKNIFVSKNIAQKLKKIGFDEPCMAFYQDYEGFDNLYVDNFATDESTSTLTDTIFVGNHNIGEDEISAPTWEQVFKWFREKKFYSRIINYSVTDEKYWFDCYFDGEIYDHEYEYYQSYEECQEALIIKLIEIYSS